MKPEDLIGKIKEDNKNKKDVYPFTNELEFIATNEIGSHDLLNWSVSSVEDSENRQLFFTDISRDRFALYMGAPPKYFKKIRSDAREFLMSQHLEDFAKTNERALIRCRDANADAKTLGEKLVVRAVLNENYVAYDNLEFAEALLGPMKEYDMTISSAPIDDDQMLIYAYCDSKAFTVGGKKYRPGILAINSETGRYKPTIDAILECASEHVLIRWPVNNGSIIAVSRQDLQKADLSLQIEKVPSVVLEEIDEMEAALNNAHNTKTKEQSGDLIASRLGHILESAKVKDNGTLRQEVVGYIKHYTNYGKKICTRLDLINAVGRAAMSGSRIKIARLAGGMLTKPQLWTGNEGDKYKLSAKDAEAIPATEEAQA